VRLLLREPILSVLFTVYREQKVDLRLHQSFYVLVDPTNRMVLGVGVIGRGVVGSHLLYISSILLSRRSARVLL